MTDDFYVINLEPGFGTDPLPIWTDRPGAIDLFEDRDPEDVTRVDLEGVPGAFQLLNVLSDSEADAIVEIAERLGFHQDAPVSLSHDIRHNKNVNWVVSEAIDAVLWERSRRLVPETVHGQAATGLNARFRFYRYDQGDYFKPHSDGSWTGSRVIDGRLVPDAYPGQRSQYTYLVFLNDGYEGGRTQFMVSRSDPTRPARRQDDIHLLQFHTPKGAALCFPHGHHPLHCLHASEPITSGQKYIIRSDILFG